MAWVADMLMEDGSTTSEEDKMAIITDCIVTPVARLPHVSIDGGVYHVDGRLVRMDQTAAELWEQARVMMAVALHVEATK